MLGSSSKNCELNCQCAGLITENFKITSGNNATKRKHEDAAAHSFKTKMKPLSLDFQKSPLTPTFEKRRILGEIQNSPLRNSPAIERLKTPIERNLSPLNSVNNYNSPLTTRNICNSPLTTRNISNSPLANNISHNSPLASRNISKSPLSLQNISNSPLARRNISNLQFALKNSSVSNCERKRTKITRIFEERTKFKMSNKENIPMMTETFLKLEMEETRDCSFGGNFEASCRETKLANLSISKLDFTDALQNFEHSEPLYKEDIQVPEKQDDVELDTETSLHDLEEEFNAPISDESDKYEIFSTDSPNIISHGRTSTRKFTAKNFVFGAPIADNEQTTSFNKPSSSARVLNFEDETFEFTSPAQKRLSNSAKKSLKFIVTPPKNTIKHEKSDSSIGSMISPCSSKRFPSESTTSIESGFISEFEEPFLDIEELSNSPKMANFNELFSGTIKEGFITKHNKRPFIHRSLSFNPEASKARVNLFSISESPDKKPSKRNEKSEIENFGSKRRKSNCESPEFERPRPVLQRAFSENNASIMSAVAKSMVDPDLIGDFSLPFALPLTDGDHSDLKSISCDTLASLIRGEFDDSINNFQVIDCRYPYEYEGGHILGAVNLYTPAQILTLVSNPLPPKEETPKRSILVFHCEFSLERGPKLSRFLRSSDRAQNQENYPLLHYPEIYLLHEGYRKFYQRYPDLCSPAGYTAMLDPQHRHLLRKHRSVQQPSSSGHRKSRLLL